MRIKVYACFIFLFVQLILFNNLVYSQNKQSAPSGQSALDLFSKGNYAAALDQFTALSKTYPRDPLYMYYRGVCLVTLEKEPDMAVTVLQGAKSGSSGVKKVPEDVAFYLGRALQMSGKFPEAVNSYKEFSVVAGKKAAKDYQISKFIQQCNDKKGALVTQMPAEKAVIVKDTVRILKKEEQKTHMVILPSERKDTARNVVQPSAYFVNLLNEALENQYKADSLVRMGLSYREQLAGAPVNVNADLKARIAETEKAAQQYQRKADDLMVTAKRLSGPEAGIISHLAEKMDSVIPKDLHEPDANRQPAKEVKDTLTKKTSGSFKEIIISNTGIKPVKDTLIKADTLSRKQVVMKAPVQLSIFAVNPKTKIGQDEKVQINPVTDPGLIYRIQLAVLRNQVLQSYFKGITPVYGFRNEGTDITNYYAGLFRKYTDASNALPKIKAAGFKDAFIVALMDRKIVSMERAALLEKEWGTRPLSTGINISSGKAATDTVPPTLVFRVEAAKNKKPFTGDQVDNLRRLAGNRGFDILKNASGITIYLIGKFLTFDSAAEYADLLSRNGYKDARVVAYLGLREIPVETARQLFEKF
jgi:hypothetical protein